MSASPMAYRWALVIALVVGFQVAFGAINDAWVALHLDEPPTIVDNFVAPEAGISAEVQRDVWLAGQSGMRSAIAGMAPWRPVTSALLALASFAIVVQTFRLRFSQQKVELALWLGQAATAAAILRTMDGAQNLVISRRMSDGMSESLVKHGIEQAQQLGALTVAAASTGSVVWSIFVVSCFVGLAAYFRSDSLRQLLANAERQEE